MRDTLKDVDKFDHYLTTIKYKLMHAFCMYCNLLRGVILIGMNELENLNPHPKCHDVLELMLIIHPSWTRCLIYTHVVEY